MQDLGRVSLLLIAPGTIAVFAGAFLWAWVIERKRHYLLMLSGACLLFCAGALSQLFYMPPDLGLNAILSNVLYTSAVLMVAEGLLHRSGKRFGLTIDLVLIISFSCLIWYFFYVDRNLVARVYIQNFGFGAILLVTTLRLTKLASGRVVDRVLFWVLLIFSVQFFPRTMLTFGFTAPAGEAPFGETFFWQALHLSIAVLGAGLAITILAAAVTDVMDDLRYERDIDQLTGVFNRRGFEERAERILSQQYRVALLLCDLDHFKKINDTYGHSAGDQVLRSFGALLSKNSREGDLVGRIGGEEFAVLMRDADVQAAKLMADRLREALDEMPLPGRLSGARITVSIGVAVLQPTERLGPLAERADLALYNAKNAGRDRVALAK